MNNYIVVDRSDSEYINIVYKILRSCSINMAKKWLFHWIPFYSKRTIRKDCMDKKVILVWNNDLKDYTSTFQMYINKDGNLYVRKIATLPKFEGKVFGKKNLSYMEQYAKENGCPKICLDVYIKSKGAITFYEHCGFNTTGIKRSIRFKELIMEKDL